MTLSLPLEHEGPRLTLRPYQKEAIEALYRYLEANDGNPVVVLPTGSGKSLVMAEIVRNALTNWPETRFLILAHVRELLEQNRRELLDHFPGVDLGIYSAGLKRRDKQNQVLVASIQSVYRRAFDFDPFDLILVDESHLIPRTSDTMYRKFLENSRVMNPHVRVIGFTATDYRLDSGRLTTGKDRFFHAVAYEANVGDLIRDGFLCRVTTKRTATQLDVSGVHTRGGEYIPGELAEAVDVDPITRAAVAEIVAAGVDRRAWLVFCASVEHANHVREAIEAHGIAAGTVTGETPTGERDRIISDFRAGRLRALTNMNVLTTGFNVPHVDLLALLRPTKSPGLYVQMVGRGTRNAPEKADCIAEGQRVLTDHGLVPIEDVTLAMKVWDGCEFVRHCGTIFRGEKEVMSYAGLVATPDHRIWTEEGWKTLGECLQAHVPVCVTGIGGQAVREADRYYRRSGADGEQKAPVSSDGMHRMQSTNPKGLLYVEEGHGRMSEVWESATGSQVARDEGYFRETAMHESERSSVPTLRRTGNRVQVYVSAGYGLVGTGEPWSTQGNGTRPDRQQQALRAREFEVSDSVTESIKHEEDASQYRSTSIQNRSSGNPLCGFDTQASTGQRSVLSANHRPVQGKIPQAKRRVWDILNAGPRHRFTTEGLLVSNCLVLDFGGVIERFGPIDALAVVEKDGKIDSEPGEAPVKACPDCQVYVLAALRVCPECGHEFPPPEKKITPRASRGAVLSDDVEPEWIDVFEVEYSRHEKPGGTPSMRVDYRIGLYRVSEWVCFEHGGFAAEKAARWWRLRSTEEVPKTVFDALYHQDSLREPIAIQVRKEGRYDRVTSYRFAMDPGTSPGDERNRERPRPRLPWERGEAGGERVQQPEAPVGGACSGGGWAGDDVPF